MLSRCAGLSLEPVRAWGSREFTRESVVISRALIRRTSLFLLSGCCPASCPSAPMLRGLVPRRFLSPRLRPIPVFRFARAAILPWRRRRPAQRLSSRLSVLPSAVVPGGSTASPAAAFRGAPAPRKRLFSAARMSSSGCFPLRRTFLPPSLGPISKTPGKPDFFSIALPVRKSRFCNP